jgi:nickel-dependent lactate racemase
MVTLPYGRAPYPLDLGDREATILELPPPPSPRPLRLLLEAALDAPIERPPVENLVGRGGRVTVIVSDATRHEPRAEVLAALRARLPDRRWTLAIATGTHGRCGVESLDLPASLLDGVEIVDHDGHSDAELVVLGTTVHGTVARVHRCVVDADLVIATGCIRPHYFAGFGAGVKSIFPGLGAARDVRHNHALKQAPGARAGIVDGNPCREDLEAAVDLLSTPTFLVNGVCASDGGVFAVVAGDPRSAFRRGVELARPCFTVGAKPADLVIASDGLPVTATLYQAAKIAAAVAPLVKAGGTLVLAAECADGTGPLDVVNEAIFRIGILPRLAAGARLGLVSSLREEVTRMTLLEPFRSIEAVLSEVHGSVIIVPRASQMLFS